MNERIKELAVQAYNWAKEESREGNNQCRIGSDYFLMMEKAKFAELIVRDIIKKIENEASTYAEPVWAFELVNDIKDAYGIEP